MKKLSEYLHFIHSHHETLDTWIYRGVLWQKSDKPPHPHPLKYISYMGGSSLLRQEMGGRGGVVGVTTISFFIVKSKQENYEVTELCQYISCKFELLLLGRVIQHSDRFQFSDKWLNNETSAAAGFLLYKCSFCKCG